MKRRLRLGALALAALLGAVAWARGPAELANAPVRWILRSPLHRVMSSQVLLLELTSRASGERYVIPVNYVAQGEALLVASDYAWWRDLEAEPRVRVELRSGAPRSGAARLVQDEGQRERGLRALRPASWERALGANVVLIEIAFDEPLAP
jgi:deazaflavin-dependent oxidoreductase (nitroreductase family)